MKNGKRVEFHLPDGMTGKELKDFLKRTNMQYFHPKKKHIESAEVEALHQGLHSALLNEKIKKGLLTKI
jgi:hypothetical protein